MVLAGLHQAGRDEIDLAEIRRASASPPRNP